MFKVRIPDFAVDPKQLSNSIRSTCSALQQVYDVVRNGDGVVVHIASPTDKLESELDMRPSLECMDASNPGIEYMIMKVVILH